MADGTDSASSTAQRHETFDNPELCRALIQSNPDCVKLLTLDGRLELMNDAGLRGMEISDFSLIAGTEWASLWPEPEQHQVRAAVASAKSGRTARFQGACPTAKGSYRWWEVSVSLVFDPAGRPWRLLSISRDITELRRLTDIETEQAQFSKLAKQVAGVGYWRLDADTRKIDWSDEMFRAYGLESSDEPQLDVALAMVHPDDRPASHERIRIALETGQGWTDALTRLIRPDGELRYVEGRGVCQRDDVGVVRSIIGTMVDVTDRRRAELAATAANAQRLRSAERTTLAVEAAQVGIWDWELESNRLVWDERMFELYGLDSAVVPDLETFVGALHPEDRDRVFVELNAAAIGCQKLETSFRIRRGDGEIRHIRALATVVPQSESAPPRMVGASWDITEFKALRATLQTGKTQLRNIIDNAHQAIVTVDCRGVVTLWNRHAELILGWTAEEAMGQPLADLIVPEHQREAYTTDVAEVMATGQGRMLDRRLELFARRKNGEEFMAEIALSAAMGPDGWEMTGLMQDISERRARVELFENAFHHAAIGMALVGLDGRFLKVNSAYSDIVGYPQARMLDLDFQTITHPDDLAADLGLLARLMAGEIPSYQMDKRYLRADGSLVWVRLSVSMVLNADGSPKHFIAQVQDLTERREAERRYRLMAENVTDVILTTDMRGRTTFVSPSCGLVTGYEAGDWVGRNPTEHAHVDDIPNLMRVFGNLADGRAGESFRWRLRHKTEDRWLWLESNPSLLQADSPDEKPLFLDVIRDVTAQVMQERALELATEAAEAATAAKAEFLANMSHEIRTPLTAIIGFSGLLSAHAGLDDTARGHSSRVSSAGNALLSLVNDILDFSKLEAGRVEIKARAVCPSELARDSLLMFTPQAHTKGLSLDFLADGDIPDFVELDPDRVRQILLNLIGNAVKFTEQGSVRLRLRYDQERLHIAVEDTGGGLSRAAQSKLFQRFSQVDASSTRRHGGTGLGLSICKGLTEAMGGEIGVRSKIGKGSTFHLSIVAPVAAPPQSNAPGTMAIGALEGVRVLIVDDNPFNRELARTVLEQAGAEISEAANGRSGVEAASSMPYDAILMDIRMPVMDGPTALRLIRSSPGPNRGIPVIAFSADPELQRFVDEAGFDGVLKKPVQPAELVEVIATWTQYDLGIPDQETCHEHLG